MTKRAKNSHIALQGGGAHGAFTWGVLDKILEDGRINIDSICATSAGSMNAVIYAYGKMQGGNDKARELLERFWYRISLTGQPSLPFIPIWMDRLWRSWSFNILDTFSHILSPYQFNPFNYNILRNILSDLVDFEALNQHQHNKLFISATNVRTGQVRIFDNSELSLDVIMASACLPYLFQAVKVGDEYYWDGGYMGNPAIFPVFYQGKTKDVIVVHINPIIRNHIPKSANEITNRINEITFNSSLLKEFRAIAFVQKLLEENWLKEEFKHKLHNIHVHSIRADEALHEYEISTKFDVDWNFLKNLRDLGRSLTSIWLDENYENIGKRSSVNLRKEFLNEHIGSITR